MGFRFFASILLLVSSSQAQLSISPSCETENNGCGIDWLQYDNGQCYLFITGPDRPTWPQAQRRCGGLSGGSHLANLTHGAHAVNLQLFWNFMQTAGKPGGSPSQFYSVAPDCYRLTWLNGGIAETETFTCSTPAWYICQRPPQPCPEVMTCDCLKQINADVMPGVNTAINELSKAVEDLFQFANRSDISPVAVRHFCFFCRKINPYRRKVKVWHYNKHRYHHCDHHKCHHCHPWHCPHCCKTHRWRRQADGEQSADIPECPINQVVATAQSAQEGTQLVNEVLAGIRADPREVSQELLDDVTGLYNDINEGVKNLQSATDINSADCNTDTHPQQSAGDVAFGR